MAKSLRLPDSIDRERLVNSSPIFSRNEDMQSGSDSDYEASDDDDDDNDAIGVVEKMEKKMNSRNERLYRPMSSPIRGERSGKGGFQSRSLGAKYTLRARRYIPFNERRRDERRANIALEKRGGNEEMERFIQTQGYKEGIDKLNEEANTHMFKIEELSEDGSNVIPQESQDTSPPPVDAYQKELEEMIRMEQEELEMLTANMTLDS